MKYEVEKNFINGHRVDSSSQKFLEVISPVDGSPLSKVFLSNSKDLDTAVAAAQKAFPAWSKMPVKERVQVFYKYKTLLERDLNSLAQLCSEENGKTLSESIAEVEKSIELTELACSLP